MIGQEQLFSTRKKDDWQTPKWIFEYLQERLGISFDLDAAADDTNHLCLRYFTEQDSALDRDWFGNVFCNPPYSIAAKFIDKACIETLGGDAKKVALLIAARTSNKEWHECIFPWATEIIFVDGRVKFSNSETGAPFPSAVVVFEEGGRPQGQQIKISTMTVRIKPDGKTRRHPEKAESSNKGLSD